MTAVRPIHRDDARKIMWGVGVVAALLLVGLVGGIVQTGGALPGKSYTYVHATFGDVGTLKTGKQVKENGLPIGVVSKIAYDHGKAQVTLRLDGKKKVYADATAAIGNASALGKKYVIFDPGHSSSGPNTTGISEQRTTDATSLEDVLSAFDPATRTALRSTIADLGGGLTGHSDDLNHLLANAPALLDNVDALSVALSKAPADVPGLLASANLLVGRFQGRENQIAGLIENANSTLSAVTVDGGRPLQQSVANLPSTLTAAKGALDDLNKPLADARTALVAIEPGGNALGAATPTLRSFLRNATVPLNEVPGVAKVALPAEQDLTGTLNVTQPALAPIKQAVTDLDQLLFPFAPYAADAGRFFSQDALLSGTLGGDDSKHYFAAALTGPGLFSVAGLPDPLYGEETYPCPGQGWNHQVISSCPGGAK